MRLSHFASAVLGPVLLAQTPPDEPGMGEACAIEGHVLSAATGQPLEGASVSLQVFGRRPSGTTGSPPSAVVSATSDEFGRFILDGLPNGTHRLWVAHEGYVRADYGSAQTGGAAGRIELRSGERVRNIAFRLLPEAVLAGRVVDAEGKPLAQAEVHALRQSYARGWRELLPAGKGESNSDGAYRIGGLAPGHYYLWAERASTSPVRGHRSKSLTTAALIPAFYPASPDLTGAVRVRAHPGTEIGGLDVTLNEAPTATLRGRILNPFGQGGQSMALIRVHPEGLDFGARVAKVKDAEGNFEVRGLRPGAYTISVEWMEGDARFTARQQVIVREADVNDVKLVLARASALRGTVRSDGRQAIGLGRVGVVFKSRGPIAVSTTAQAAESGEFNAPDLPPETYSISLTGLPSDCYLKSIRFGNQQLPDISEFEYSGAPAALDILLGCDGGQISATVLDGNEQRLPGVHVVAVPSGSRRGQTSFYRSSSTSQNGEAVLTGLAPGDYKVFAWADIEPGAYYDPDLIRMVESGGQSVQVREQSRISVNLKPLGDPAR